MNILRIHRAACLALAGLAALLCSLAWAAPQRTDMPLARMDFGKHRVLAEVPVIPAQRLKGLGGRKSLEAGRGMLFIFYGKAVSMCMRDMNFPLDFIWLNQGKVSQITPEVPPGGDSVTVRSRGEAQMVLEVPAGWAKEHGVHVGQAVSITPLDDKLPPVMTRVLHQEKP
ncbi:MAG: DUF192 domain-containing protein [Desulfarculus sp.]|nr:DUF192 domain-containing protein [Pseudomonadota bacterium]MBV1717095.1 DUF192 domain-containing protein [Desulfarculus sp.]MBU4574245.1 DUF192 domain-containing protein [Pseudomonadota bacterium]MBU4598321.1 DUF192 domain-containing protein [Pseudomonadota bacterium]MBV1740391.1 DUF192 domain-containing protein [Desulfarculus sp.]